MSIDEFWDLVDRVHIASGGDMDKKCILLADALRLLGPEEVESFEEHFRYCSHQAYAWDIWGAAFIINGGGCGDDKFMDFRSTLISTGRRPFEAALQQADSLADFEIDRAWATFEGYQYVASRVYEEMTKKEISISSRHPKEPTGVEFDDQRMSSRFPKLAAKYGHKDVPAKRGKKQNAKGVKDFKMIHRIAALMLEAKIVSSSGFIPPLPIAAKVLQTGRTPEATGRQVTWEPIELDEQHYRVVTGRLLGMKPKDLLSRPDLQGVKLTLDPMVPGSDDFDSWMGSLKERGLV